MQQHPDPWTAFAEAVRSGNEKEARKQFESLYCAERSQMVRFAQWCVRRHNPGLIPGFLLDPDEIVDDAFAELFIRCESIRKEPRKWFLGFIRLRLAHAVSKSLREDRAKPEAQQHLDQLGRNRKSRGSLSRQKLQAIRQAVNALPGRMRAVIIGLFYRGESVATLAVLMGVTENTVIKTKRRALKKIEVSM